MKKFTFLALALSAINAMAWEANIKGGYDFVRSEVTKPKSGDATPKALESGWVVGAEFIPFNKGVVEFGVGTEYNFGIKSLKYEGVEKKSKRYTVPVYALGKLNLVRSEDNSSALYALGRLGYAFSNETDENGKSPVSKNGLYYGAGLGVEVGSFLIEGLYDGTYNGKDTAETKTFVHKFGIRAGFRFGDYMKEAPVVVETPVVVAPAVVETPVVAPVVVESKGRLIHASCSETEKKCVIHGFKVDGREPSAEEKANIAEIAQLVNSFAVAGEAKLIGHTDSTGSDAYNQKLSVARAQSVNKLLREAGLKDTIHIHEVLGKGEKEPMATNKTKQGRYLNRRVEILFDELQVR